MSNNDKAAIRAELERKTRQLIDHYHGQRVLLDEAVTEMGWLRDDAGLVFMYAWAKHMRDLYLVSFHKGHLTVRTPIQLGFPDTPFVCECCGDTIASTDELLFDFCLDVGLL